VDRVTSNRAWQHGTIDFARTLKAETRGSNPLALPTDIIGIEKALGLFRGLLLLPEGNPPKPPRPLRVSLPQYSTRWRQNAGT